MSEPKSAEYDDLLREDRSFVPPAEFRAKAHVSDDGIYAEAERDPEAFWAKFAGELQWFRKWDTILDWQPPHAKWFVGGQLNASVNCLDRHLAGPRRNKAALIWEGEPGDHRTYTYSRPAPRSVTVRQRAAVAWRDEGRPRRALPAAASPNSPSRCSRARASAPSTASCSAASAPSRCAIASTTRSAQLLVTADGGYRRGQIVPLKQIADEALKDTPSIKNVVLVQRGAGPMPVHVQEGRDHWYHRLMQDAAAQVRARGRWTRRTCSTSSTPPARPGSRRASSTRRAAIWSARTRRRSSCST